MSDSTQPSDPYQSPAYFGEQDFPDATIVPRRPGVLTAICIIAIILGVLGIMSGLVSVLSLVAGQALQKSFTPSLPPGTEDEAFEIQTEMNEKIQEMGRRFVIPNTVLVVALLAVATGLIVGGAMSLGLKPRGRTVLLAVFCAAIVFEFLRCGYMMYVQMQTMAVMNEYIPRMIEASTPQPGGAGGPNFELVMQVMMVVMKVVMYGMLVMGLLIKGGFYLFGALYLAKQKTKRLFDEAAAAQSPAGIAGKAV